MAWSQTAIQPALAWGTRLMESMQPRADPSWSLPARQWANPKWALICALALFATCIHPPQGMPMRLCAIRLALGVDCPGCGMTRGLSHLWRGHWAESLAQHPLAPVTFGYLAFQSSFLILGGRARLRVVGLLNRADGALAGLFWVGLIAFMTFGLIRMWLELLGLAP